MDKDKMARVEIGGVDYYNAATIRKYIRNKFELNVTIRDIWNILHCMGIDECIRHKVKSGEELNWYPADKVDNKLKRVVSIEPTKLKAIWKIKFKEVDVSPSYGYFPQPKKEKPIVYKNDEDDMEGYSNYLINNVYQTEGKRIIKITESAFSRLFEDVFMTNPDTKSKKVHLIYNKNHGRYNKNNASSFDYIKTDKMDINNSDTYEVPLKGGIVSYNITSINGTEVMHYFKRIFDKQKTYAKLMKYGNEEYELEMEDSEFKRFMEQFTTKIENVVSHETEKMKEKGIEINELFVFPVPSSSRFNLEMAKRIQFTSINGFKPKMMNEGMLKKDLSNLEKDSDFIEKNKEYYNQRYSDNLPQHITHSDYVNKEFNRFESINKAQRYINIANDYAKKLIQKYYTRKEHNTDKFYAKLNELYLSYIEAVNNIAKTANYFDTVAKKQSNIQLGKVAKELKYSKGPSIEERTNAIYNMLKDHGYLHDMPQSSMTQVCYWEPINFQIKKLSNDVRMAFKNYFQPNDEVDINNEKNNAINSAIIIFDDNVSGGATLSDVCLQFKKLGFSNLIPITFGKMKEAWNARTIVVNKPKNWNF